MYSAHLVSQFLILRGEDESKREHGIAEDIMSHRDLGQATLITVCRIHYYAMRLPRIDVMYH